MNEPEDVPVFCMLKGALIEYVNIIVGFRLRNCAKKKTEQFRPGTQELSWAAIFHSSGYHTCSCPIGSLSPRYVWVEISALYYVGGLN